LSQHKKKDNRRQNRTATRTPSLGETAGGKAKKIVAKRADSSDHRGIEESLPVYLPENSLKSCKNIDFPYRTPLEIFVNLTRVPGHLI
jgi:hypothetical protein